MIRVRVQPEIYAWALDRSGLTPERALQRFPKLGAWRRGEAHPTLKQLEAFARATHTAVGFFFLAAPPVEAIPIPDFRTVAGRRGERPSADLLDTIYQCQRRLDWYSEHAAAVGEPEREYVGSATLADPPGEVAASIRKVLGFDVAERRALANWTEGLRHLINRAESAGVLVMVNGVVGHDTHRPLDVDEFRGFAIADRRAPLVFLNGRDSRAAMSFTLAHELAHLWLGQSALTDASVVGAGDDRTERWCNRVAADVLVPTDAVRMELAAGGPTAEIARRISRTYRVSTLVALRRLHDIGALGWDALWREYETALSTAHGARRSGGDFYRTLNVRVGNRLARALVASTLEGHTTFTEAFRLLGIRSVKSFDHLEASLGLAG
jgi:Zn-dependent peptidase ImmA (M78 family)